MTSHDTSSLNRILHGINCSLLVALLLALGMGYRVQWALTEVGSPYEGWDEIAAFNNSAVLSGPSKWRVYSYGTLDTAKMLLGRTYVSHLRPLSPFVPHNSYSNNVPDSWNGAPFDFNSRTWADLSAIDYNYFRGTPDRLPIFITRKINLIFNYAGLLIVGIFAIRKWGLAGVSIASVLCVLSTTIEWCAQTHQALPNAPNAVLAFAIMVFVFDFLRTESTASLSAAAICVALGINHKFDFLLLASLPAVGLLCFCAAHWKSPGKAFKLIFVVGVCFLAALAMTNPYLCTVPIREIKYQWAIATGMSGNIADPSVNLAAAASFLTQSISLNLSGTAPTSLRFLAEGVTVLSLGALFFAPKTSWIFRIGCGLLFATALLLLAVPVLRAVQIYNRYFLNAWAAALAVVGCCLATLQSSERKTLRIFAVIGTTLFSSGALMRQLAWNKHAAAYAANHDKTYGVDLQDNRNRAALDAIQMIKRGDASLEILVDQHAYLDLRSFSDAGIKVRYLNCVNFRSVFDSIADKNYVVLFTRGTYEIQPRWQGLWESPLRLQYDDYVSFLLSLREIKAYPGNKMQLLNWRPPQPNDEMRLALFSPKHSESHVPPIGK